MLDMMMAILLKHKEFAGASYQAERVIVALLACQSVQASCQSVQASACLSECTGFLSECTGFLSECTGFCSAAGCAANLTKTAAPATVLCCAVL